MKKTTDLGKDKVPLLVLKLAVPVYDRSVC